MNAPPMRVDMLQRVAGPPPVSTCCRHVVSQPRGSTRLHSRMQTEPEANPARSSYTRTTSTEARLQLGIGWNIWSRCKLSYTTARFCWMQKKTNKHLYETRNQSPQKDFCLFVSVPHNETRHAPSHPCHHLLQPIYFTHSLTGVNND